MYKIFRGSEAFGKGIPYIIVTVSAGKDKDVYLESFILVINPDKGIKPVLVPLETHLKGWDQFLKVDPNGFGLSKLLDEESHLAKRAFSNWLKEQVEELTFVQIKQLEWEEITNAVPLALECISNTEVHKIIQHIMGKTHCDELGKFLGTFANLRLELFKN